MIFSSKPAVIADDYHSLINILKATLREEQPPSPASRPALQSVILEGGEIEVCPLPYTVKVSRLSRSGVLESLKGVVGKDAFRPALQGVYFTNSGEAVATNGFILIETPYEAIESDKGKIIDPKDGSIINYQYPPYTEVLNGQLAGMEHTIERLNIDTMLAKLKGILKAYKFFARDSFTPRPLLAAIPIGLGVAMFDPAQLYEALAALARLGTAEVDLSFPSLPPGSYSLVRGIVFRDCTIRNRVALVLPLRMGDRISETAYTYVIPRLALYERAEGDEVTATIAPAEQRTKVAA